MRRHLLVFIALLIAPAPVTAQEQLGTYEDRIAVEDVMGSSKDRLVKRNNMWLIQERTLNVFAD